MKENVFRRPGGGLREIVKVKLPRSKFKYYKKVLKSRGIELGKVKVNYIKI